MCIRDRSQASGAGRTPRPSRHLLEATERRAGSNSSRRCPRFVLGGRGIAFLIELGYDRFAGDVERRAQMGRQGARPRD
eukprot:9026193-Alexandrium_andersonii.AAC.1